MNHHSVLRILRRRGCSLRVFSPQCVFQTCRVIITTRLFVSSPDRTSAERARQRCATPKTKGNSIPLTCTMPLMRRIFCSFIATSFPAKVKQPRRNGFVNSGTPSLCGFHDVSGVNVDWKLAGLASGFWRNPESPPGSGGRLPKPIVHFGGATFVRIADKPNLATSSCPLIVRIMRAAASPSSPNLDTSFHGNKIDFIHDTRSAIAICSTASRWSSARPCCASDGAKPHRAGNRGRRDPRPACAKLAQDPRCWHQS